MGPTPPATAMLRPGTEAGRAGTALGRSVGVPLGETGRLGLARPGGRRGGAEERLRRVLRALGSSPTCVFRGRWRRAASTVRAPRCGRRGPRQGRPAFAIRSGWMVLVLVLVAVDRWAPRSSTPRREARRTRVRPKLTMVCSGFARRLPARPAPAGSPIFGLGKVSETLGRFFQSREKERSQGSPLAQGAPPGVPDVAARSPDSEARFLDTRWPEATPDSWFSEQEGKGQGGRAPAPGPPGGDRGSPARPRPRTAHRLGRGHRSLPTRWWTAPPLCA